MTSSSTPFGPTKFHLAAAVEAHSQKALLPHNPQLEAAIANSQANNLPKITVTPLAGQHLALQARLVNAKNILEIGALGGYSTIWLASTGAKVTSIEIDPKRRDIALENTKGLDVEIILGAALDVLPKLAAEGRVFDFVFIDADWGEQSQYFDWAVKMTRDNGCIYVDNVVRELIEGELLGDGKESLVTSVGRDRRVWATLVPTVGSNKDAEEMFDGFVLAVVKPRK